MKTDVEELSPTRVKLTIEVPFEELKSSLDKAYREVGRQVRVPGFRPGRVPPRIIDQRFGRGVVLEQAVNEAVPQLYGKALADNEVFALGQPELEITKLDDGKELAFTAEVDVRPRFDVPSLDGLEVSVDNAVVSPDEVEEFLGSLRERFSSLTTADRPAQRGDFVSIDLSAFADGEELEDARASGMSYEIGGTSLLDGLDDAMIGMTAGETKTFTTTLASGDQAGETADVTVTVHSVKVKKLPELDDEFAQSASEFDTVGELRADTRGRLERIKRLQQVNQARDRALETLLGKIDIPLPDSVVQSEIDRRNQSLDQQLESAGVTKDAYLTSVAKTVEEFDAELELDARRMVKVGFVLDQIALQEELGVEDGELTNYVVEQAYRMGVAPDQLAKHLTDSGQLRIAVTDVLQAKALGIVVERAKVSDEAGREIDVKELTEEANRTDQAGGRAAESTATNVEGSAQEDD